MFETFDQLRQARAQAKGETRGRLGKDEVDVLRAAIVFTSSGLDAFCQQLVSDTAPKLIEFGGTAATRFEEYLKQELSAPKLPKELVEAVVATEPRSKLIKLYIRAKTKASFQGSKDLKSRVSGLLGIPNTRMPESRFTDLDSFFTSRNHIVHQLDYVNPDSTSTSRHHRNADEVSDQCGKVLTLVADLIHATADLLRA